MRSIFSRVADRFETVVAEDFVANWPESAPDLNPKTVLGVSTTHETAACIVRDGQIVSAVSEERISRKKTDSAYPPRGAVDSAILAAGIDPREIDAIAIAGLDWRGLLPQTWESQKRDLRDYHGWNDYFPHFCKFFYRLYYFVRATGYRAVSDYVARTYGVYPKVFYVEHHEAHAWSVYGTSGQKSPLLVTADGVGDDISLTVNTSRGGLIRRVFFQYYPHSFGQFYTALTQYLGFTGGRHEGKITGLAAYGAADPELVSRIESTLRPSEGFKLDKRYYSEGFVRNIRLAALFGSGRGVFGLFRQGFGTSDAAFDYRTYKRPLAKILDGYSREDLANAYQHLTERELVRIVSDHNRAGGIDLGVAGGVMANVKLNQALSRVTGVHSFYAFPNMGDGGLCVGAALAVQGKPARRIDHVYLGESAVEDQILEALADSPAELSWHQPENAAKEAAKNIVAGRVVARFAGRMEFGPRALGNRSILYHGADPSVNDWLNDRLQRSEFMPFAPIFPIEDAPEYFDVRDGELHACQFMMLVVNATERMKRDCPAAVHVDGTC